jgi:hypothetical protein
MMEETSIMYSDDKTIELTSHRIIQHTAGKTNQLMLEEFQNYEFKTASIGYYKTVVIVFLILTIVAVLFNVRLYYPAVVMADAGITFWEYLWTGVLMKACCVLLFLSYLFYVISRRYFVRLNGKANFIEFRIASRKNSTIRKLLDAIVLQSDIVKATAGEPKKM